MVLREKAGGETLKANLENSWHSTRAAETQLHMVTARPRLALAVANQDLLQQGKAKNCLNLMSECLLLTVTPIGIMIISKQ